MRDYTFGNLITRLRVERGYSQFQLGKLLRISGKAVSKWENGSAKPRMETCCKLAEILGVSLDMLLSPGQVGPISVKRNSIQEERRKGRMNDRKDTAKKKHIELHVRTGFSGIKGFGLPGRYLDLADEWNLPAIAITDYGATRGFPNVIREARKGIKIILGCELPVLPAGATNSEDAFPVMLLVRNRTGLVHLNHILTEAFLQENGRQHCTTWECINQYRDGLLAGCSCNNGEVIRMLWEGRDETDILNSASQYDYLEIEPVENTLPENSTETDELAAEEERKQVVRIGKECGIPVAAVGNVWYPEPENAFDYAVLRYNSGEIDREIPGTHYLRTTSEMNRAFRFLGTEDCRKVVIDDPQKIADQIEKRVPLYPEENEDDYGFWPASEGDARRISREAREKARELYGNPLPQIVRERLDKELCSLENPHTAFQFALTQRLIRKSEEDGYPVSSRGSIASSLAAMLIGITDINPLPPHYRCPVCKASEFDIGGTVPLCGPDLPAKTCSRCGGNMVGDGYRIPCEVLFGWAGDKPVDIDLNFADVYQKETHRQVKELFGEDRVCNAGTVAGMGFDRAEKSIRRYLNDHDMVWSNQDIEQRANEYWNVADQTGCHPGGLVIAPEGRSLVEFSPLQYAESEAFGNPLVTHYDFNTMRDILLKMDILSHRTPTLLHLLREKTGINPQTVSLRDDAVISLFRSTEPLGIAEGELLCKTGTYGIPEFQSAFIQGILKQIMPTTVEELIRISGWAHGTGVWHGNAQLRIALDPKAWAECPASRDDIMNFLQDHGIDEEKAFRIMEDVRKGKGIKPENVKLMKDYGLTDAYIAGCQRIKYLFPKAHAVSYVENSLRVAWFKIHHPEAFYQCWFHLLSDSIEEKDYHRTPRELRREILELRNYDAFDNNQDIDRQWALELILEAQLRGIDILK